MPSGICKLCGDECELQLSHFIPRFVGRWIKETSATGYIRLNQNVNKRAQDISKDYWLCRSCEQLFSGWERDFANKVFYPFLNDGKHSASYDDWFAKFAASLSWRTLTYMRSLNKGDVSMDSKILDTTQMALADFLNGKSKNLGKYEQHFYHLDSIESSTVPSLPSNINRYFLRNMHMDVLRSGKDVMIYTKLPGFIFLGLTGHPQSTRMRGSRISISGGKISPGNFFWPSGFAEYLMEKANNIKALYQSINKKQMDLIGATIKRDPEKMAKSKTLEAFRRDHEMFGDKAFSDET